MLFKYNSQNVPKKTLIHPPTNFSGENCSRTNASGSTIKSITNHIIVLPIQSDCHSRHMAARRRAEHSRPRPHCRDKVEITM